MKKLIEEQKIIAENAELIAKFEGFEVITDFGYRMIIYGQANERTAIDTYYHSSWDWLMPVVEKIFKNQDLNLGYDAYKSEEAMLIKKALVKVNLKATYKAVVEFIKWYNQQNNSHED